eukprot:1888632-Pyramimonas_sp.AAC.1
MERLVDLMVLREADPQLSARWPTLMVFLGKPDGSGVRPIALICSILRVWGKVRRDEAKLWEDQHAAGVFWGVRDRECDRAGWVHQTMAHYARSKGMQSATLATDLDKLYERICHAILFAEAEAVKFSTRL